ncbi:hypothetical protein [Sphingomonas sp. ERG5]|uniref:hypothetical protein n=1 Tax=Sphingomonas sp. ERG5 TaxID=1381597 RepID=UPI001364C373|nr:hypothetical protein [Sphingomonas sp. ERG5]
MSIYLIASAMAATSPATPADTAPGAAIEARAEALPIYNFDSFCRKLAGGDFEKDVKCGEQEGAAYAKLEEIWASVPEARKIECHNVAYDPDTGAGSYALHLRCIEKGK